MQESHLNIKGRHHLRTKIFRANGPKRKAGVAILISNKIDFKPKLIKRDKEGHYILIKDPPR